MNRAAEAATEITEEFGFLDDWEDRYQLLIDQGRLYCFPFLSWFWTFFQTKKYPQLSQKE